MRFFRVQLCHTRTMGQLVVCFPLIQRRIPLMVRTQSACHRGIYALFMVGYLMILVFMPRSALWRYRTWWNQKGAVLNVPHVVFLSIAMLICGASYAVLQASDPGYLRADVSQRFRKQRLARERERARARGDAPLSGRDEEEVEVVFDEEEDGDIELGGTEGGSGGGALPAARAKAHPPSPRAAEFSDSSSHSDSDSGEGLLDSFAVDLDAVESEDDWGVAAVAPDGDDWPLRSHYIRALNVRVAGYDHFCGCVGTPIGERNRCKAWVATALHLALALWAGILSMLSYHAVNHLGNFWPLNWMSVISTVLIVPVTIFLTFMFFIFTLNIITNMTTYELLKGSLGKIRYLDGTEVMDIPFSGGICENVWIAITRDGVWNDLPPWCCQDGRRTRGCGVDAWEPKDYPPIDLPFRPHNNCYRNRYWSCC